MIFFARFLDPFIDQTAGSIQWVCEQIRPAHQIMLKEGHNGTWITLDGHPIQAMIPLHGSDLTLLLDERDFLTVDLTLPIAAKAYIDDIIASRIDLISPWNRENAIFGIALISETSTMITVIVAVTSKEAINRKIDQLRRLQPRSLTVRLTVHHKGKPTDITLPIFSVKTISPVKRRDFVSKSLYGSLLVIGILIAACFLIRLYLDAEQARIQSQILALRATLNPASLDDAVIRDPVLRMNQAKNNHWPKVELLAQLAEILPDDTYLDALDLTTNGIRIEGQSKQVADLPRILGQNTIFSEISFTAPIIKREGRRGDLFELGMKVSDRGHTRP